jgi:hypothetical protein
MDRRMLVTSALTSEKIIAGRCCHALTISAGQQPLHEKFKLERKHRVSGYRRFSIVHRIDAGMPKKYERRPDVTRNAAPKW